MPVVTASSGHLVSEDTKCYRIAGRTQKRQLKDIRISIYSCKNQRIYAIKY
jgi:hypothetical protein